MDDRALPGGRSTRRDLLKAASLAAVGAWGLPRVPAQGAEIPAAFDGSKFQLKAPEPNPKSGGVLRYGITSRQPHFDVHQSATVNNIGTQGCMFDNLVRHIAVDNEAGTSLQKGAEQFIQAAGGTVLSAARAPVGNADFSSYLLQAKASGAKVIGLANAGADLQNCIKQAAEFGIAKGGQLLATLLLEINDVLSIGQDACQGLVLPSSFYWNLSPETRAWTARYVPKMNKPPGTGQACAYSATLHWLKAAKAAGTLDADAVATKMHDTPLHDFFNQDVRILANGAVPHTHYLWIVKPSSETKERWDVFKLIGTLPSPSAFPPADAFGCPLAKA